MPEYFIKNTQYGLHALSSAQRSQIKVRWDMGLYSAVVSSLIMSAYNHHRGTMGSKFAIHGDVAFDGLDGNFVVRGTNLRATVKLNLVYIDSATHATVDVATSWPVTEKQKLELEKDKARILGKKFLNGQDLNGLVYLRYDTCEPATEELMRNIAEKTKEISMVAARAKTTKEKMMTMDMTPEEEELLIAEMEEGISTEEEAEEYEEEVQKSGQEMKGIKKVKGTKKRK
ncbi:hypothetical protein PG987_013605 [Apiospora arundinis]